MTYIQFSWLILLGSILHLYFPNKYYLFYKHKKLSPNVVKLGSKSSTIQIYAVVGSNIQLKVHLATRDWKQWDQNNKMVGGIIMISVLFEL